jgi:hypothetical protein
MNRNPMSGQTVLNLGRRNPVIRIAFMVGAVVLLTASLGICADNDPTADAHAVPAIDGNIGPCSVEFTVTDAGNAAVYNARIRVHIAYRFLSAHKLDLEVGTNVDGKARVSGLPEKVKEALQFKASQADRYGETFWNPAEGCTAKRAIVLKAEDKSAQQP